MSDRACRSAVETAALLVALLGTSTCKGCQGRQAVDERPRLTDVAVTRISGATVRDTKVTLDGKRIVAKAKAVLVGGGFFGTSTTAAGSARVTLDLEVLGEGSGETPEIGVKVRLKVEVRPIDSSGVRFAEDAAAIGQVPLDRASAHDLGGAFQRLAERTTEDLLMAYVARKKLWLADEREVAKALASEDNDLRLEAIRVTGVRKLRRELPTILRLLSDDDEATRDAALGAVVAMGETGAIKALAESHQMRDSYEMGKVLDAVASLGGQEAKEYLSFVAETHDDPEIRSMAREALDRLGKHEVKVTPTR
jgi:hypothetical protein